MITRLFFYIDFFANKYIVKKKHVAIVRNFIVTKVLCIPTKTQFLVWFVTVTVLSIATYQVHVKYQYVLCSSQHLSLWRHQRATLVVCMLLQTFLLLFHIFCQLIYLQSSGNKCTTV